MAYARLGGGLPASARFFAGKLPIDPPRVRHIGSTSVVGLHCQADRGHSCSGGPLSDFRRNAQSRIVSSGSRRAAKPGCRSSLLFASALVSCLQRPTRRVWRSSLADNLLSWHDNLLFPVISLAAHPVSAQRYGQSKLSRSRSGSPALIALLGI